MLGGLLALCAAATFAFNNASVRRAVLTGSILQGMAITVPMGVPLFFFAALVTGNLATVFGFSPTALAASVTFSVEISSRPSPSIASRAFTARLTIAFSSW